MRNFRAQKSQNFGEADLIEREESLEMKHHLETSQIVQIGFSHVAFNQKFRFLVFHFLSAGQLRSFSHYNITKFTSYYNLSYLA